MQESNSSPQLQQQPPRQKSQFAPLVFRSKSARFSTFRIFLIHEKEPLCLAGAFRFQCLAGAVVAKEYVFRAQDFNMSNLIEASAPSPIHVPILFKPEKGSPPLFENDESLICKRINALDFKFDPIREAIVKTGYTAIILVTDPPMKIKPLEYMTKWQIFKPLPSYEPEEISAFCYQTKPIVEDNLKFADFCKRIHAGWMKKPITVGMIIGPKDSGKSTLARSICNTLLCSLPFPDATLYYMDLDVGQSEFTPPGLISLFKVEKPFLGAPFTSQVKAFPCSYFFGDITPESDLDLYYSIITKCFEDFFKITTENKDAHSLLIINTLGWVDNLGHEITDKLFEILAPGYVLALKKNYIYVPSSYKGQRVYKDAHEVLNHEKISATKLRDLLITGYFTQCFSKSMKLELVSFSNVTVRMVSFKNIGIFIHPSNPVSENAYLAALNMSTVALCTIPENFKASFEWKRLCDQENLPSKIDYAENVDVKPFFKCVGYGLIRAISIEKGKFFIITPADEQFLVDVNVLALGDDINTSRWIFQTQNAHKAPYLMCYKDQSEHFQSLSMPLKIVGAHKRNVIRGNAR